MVMLCKLCKKHGKVPQSGKGSWCTEPCFPLRKDKVVKHTGSRIHHSATVVEAENNIGGIRQAFQDAVTLEVRLQLAAVSVFTFFANMRLLIPQLILIF